MILESAFLPRSLSAGCRPEGDIWLRGESHEKDNSAQSKKAWCTNLRGQSPLFHDLTDKTQAGNPTIDVELNASLFFTAEEVLDLKKGEEGEESLR